MHTYRWKDRYNLDNDANAVKKTMLVMSLLWTGCRLLIVNANSYGFLVVPPVVLGSLLAG